jgi:stage V sporulation protein SpoVS
MAKKHEDSIEATNVQDEKTRIPDPAELRAASDSSAPDMSKSIIAKFKEHGYVKIRGIGPAAIGKAFTAFTIARAKLSGSGIEAVSYGSFFDVKMGDTVDKKTGEGITGEIKTGITICIEDR